jgi:hypothetical protein
LVFSNLFGRKKRVAIGAISNDGDNGAFSGHVRVFDFDGVETWNQIGQDIDGEAAGDQSGWSVTISSDGTRVAIGAIGNVGTTGRNTGRVRVFDFDGDETWIQVGGDIDGEAAGDQSGLSVSISSDGTRVAIGAINGSSGHVRVFDFDGDETWIQVGGDIDGKAAGDLSGFSIAMSSNGSRVAIGAPFNGGDTGHVRVFDFDSAETSSQIGQDIDGEAAGDSSGFSLAISSNGNRVAIGATLIEGRMVLSLLAMLVFLISMV